MARLRVKEEPSKDEKVPAKTLATRVAEAQLRPKPKLVIQDEKVPPKPRLRVVETTIHASIDIGSVNFCICIQRRTPRDGKTDRVRIVLWEKWNLAQGSKCVTIAVLDRLTKQLDAILPLLQETSFFHIEKQRSLNHNAVRMEQHTLSYLLLKFPEKPRSHFFSIPSSMKYTANNCPKGLTKYKKKRWSPVKAMELLEERGDYEGIAILEEGIRIKKADDFADAYIQIEAGCKRYVPQVEGGELS